MKEETQANNSGKKILLVAALVILALVATAGGSLAYAYFSNENIPVLSDVVETVEKTVISEEQFAEEVQTGLSEMLITTAKTATDIAEKENVIKQDLSEEAFDSYLRSTQEVTSYNSKGEMEVNVSVAEQSNSPAMDFSFTVDSTGKYVNRGEKVGLESSLNGAYLAEGINVNFAGDFKIINDEFFLKLNTIPALGLDLSDLKNKWMELDFSENQEMAEAMAET